MPSEIPTTDQPRAWGVNPEEARARNDALMIASQTRRIAELEAQTTADMGADAMEVVRVTPWKTKAGQALRRRDAIVAAGGNAIVIFEMPGGWHVREVPHTDD